MAGAKGFPPDADLQRLVDVLPGSSVIPRIHLGGRQVRQRLAHVLLISETPVHPQGILKEGDRGCGLAHRAVHNADVVCAHGHTAAVPDRRV